MFGYDLGIDLGTSNLVISVPGKGVVVNEPSYVAYDIDSGRMLYAGRRAYYLEGREPQGVAVVRPIHDGVISNYDLTQQMVKYFINRVIKKNIFKPRVVASAPALATDVEKRTLISVIITAGARSVCLLESPLCAAFGSKVDPSQPTGAFVVDIGGGTTELAVVTKGAMSQVETLKFAGNTFDDEIVRYMKDNHEILIGVRTAEEIKKTIGCAIPREEDVTMTAKGRSAVDGMPKTVEVSSNEICACLKPMLDQIVAAATVMLERTSPQLVGDIAGSGIYLTGGSAELFGLDELFKQALDLDVNVVLQPALCVAKGASVALDKMGTLDNYGYRFRTKEDVRIR